MWSRRDDLCSLLKDITAESTRVRRTNNEPYSVVATPHEHAVPLDEETLGTRQIATGGQLQHEFGVHVLLRQEGNDCRLIQ